MHIEHKRTRGLTLIEIMVVIAILGLLGTVVSVNVIRQLDNAKLQRFHTDAASVQQAVNLFRMDTGRLPRELHELYRRPADVPRWSAYLTEEPTDPWGNPYTYERRAEGFTLTSYGADGAPGGQAEDADLIYPDPTR